MLKKHLARWIFGGVLLCCTFLGAETEKVIIAHRGACGYLPEHTLASYAMAYAMGAHYIEPDLAMTRDQVLICLHDSTLEATTNVAEIFPDRKRGDGKYYPADFLLEEIRQLHTRERFPQRFPRETQLFQIPTLEEMIQLIQGLNTVTGRNVGIYPELKDPSFYKDENLPFAEKLLEILSRYGYEGPNAKVFIQCFSPSMLMQLRDEYKTTLPLMQLISDNAMLEGLGMEKIAGYAQAIGPNKKCIEDDATLTERAHAAGLLVHPYTFRADLVSSKYKTIENELNIFLFEHNIDGGFIDHPDKMKSVLDSHK
jgi:glycerophosphoryl diester phosphodiesterase